MANIILVIIISSCLFFPFLLRKNQNLGPVFQNWWLEGTTSGIFNQEDTSKSIDRKGKKVMENANKKSRTTSNVNFLSISPNVYIRGPYFSLLLLKFNFKWSSNPAGSVLKNPSKQYLTVYLSHCRSHLTTKRSLSKV